MCLHKPQTYAKWQQDAFDKSYTAFQALQSAYDQAVAKAGAQAMGIQIEGRNPGINLSIIKNELKKHCLTMLTGMQFNNFHGMSNPPDQPTHLPEIDPIEALDEGRFIEFFEQAFEWEQITYLFYPYFWGRKSNWIMLSNQSDPDPAFMQFLQAGAVRIVLPVSRAYDDAMAYFLQPRILIPVAERIWQGGGPPTITDPLFVSIAEGGPASRRPTISGCRAGGRPVGIHGADDAGVVAGGRDAAGVRVGPKMAAATSFSASWG